MSTLETDLDRLIELIIKPVPAEWRIGFQEIYHRRGSGFHDTSGPETPLPLAKAAREAARKLEEEGSG
jgi:hypothetical protein